MFVTFAGDLACARLLQAARKKCSASSESQYTFGRLLGSDGLIR
jgi:hypothetical protein